jgi:putative MATE family efflux protein
MRKLWNIFKESLGGGEQDYTAMGVRRAIVLLSIPMIMEMGMEALFALVDLYWVGRLGDDATATIGLTESLLMTTYCIAWGLAMGATAVVARRKGEKDEAGMRMAAGQSLRITLILGVCLSVIGSAFSSQLLELMGASDKVLGTGSTYSRIMQASNIIIMVLFSVNAVFRGAGNAGMALRSLGLANLLNIILDPLLILGIGPFPELGVTGAAVATTTGRTCGVIFQLYFLFRSDGPFALRGEHMRHVREVTMNILKVSAGSVGQFLIASASWTVLVKIIATSGTAAVAGYTTAIRIIIFTLLPAWGMANAAATLVGQNLGAGQPDRSQRSAWLCGHYNAVFMVAVAMVFWMAAELIVPVFGNSAEANAYAVDALRIISLGYLFYGYGMVLAQAFNGAGDSVTPTWLNVVCFWCMEIPLAWLFGVHLGYGPNGAFASVAISESALAVLSAVIFQRGKWKLVKV